MSHSSAIYELCGPGQIVKHLGVSFFIHKTGRGRPPGRVVDTLEIRWNVAACLAQCAAHNHPHKDGNYFQGHNAGSPRIVIFFNAYLLSTFYVSGTVQGTVATVVNKIDKASGVHIIGGGKRK